MVVMVVVMAVVAVEVAVVIVPVVVSAVVVAVVVVLIADVTNFVVVVVAAVALHTVGDIEPEEPVNMTSPVNAFELTQKTPQSIWSKDVAP